MLHAVPILDMSSGGWGRATLILGWVDASSLTASHDTKDSCVNLLVDTCSDSPVNYCSNMVRDLMLTADLILVIDGLHSPLMLHYSCSKNCPNVWSFYDVWLITQHYAMGIIWKKPYLIVFHLNFQMNLYSSNLNENSWHSKLNKIITHWDSFWTFTIYLTNTLYDHLLPW